MFRCMGHSMSGVGVLDKAVVILGACVDGASLAELVDRTKLRDATGESAQLYLRRADERICVAAAERASGLRDTVPVGAVLPMIAGSAAQILLAWEPPEAVMPLLPRCKFTGRTLAEVRRRGWAQSVAEREAGVASVSAPVRDRTGRVIAAISVSGPIERLGRRPGDRHAMAVVRAGQRLSGL